MDRAAAPRRARIGIDRVEAAQAEHRARVESERVGLQPVDLGDRDPARAARRRAATARAGRRAAARPGRRARAPSRSSGTSRASPPVIASSRSQKREATVGDAGVAPGAGDQHLRGAPSALAKSCAARPIRRSSAGRPSSARICGASQGSGAGSAGQTPSLSPPRIIRSACCSRASSRPQMKMRGCSP